MHVDKQTFVQDKEHALLHHKLLKDTLVHVEMVLLAITVR